MTILISSASYVFSDELPGGEFQVVHAIVSHLAARGHRLHVFAPRVELRQPIPNVKTYAFSRYDFLNRTDYARYRWNWWVFSVQTYLQARKLLRKERIDVIHHIRPAFPEKFSLCWSLGCPFVYGPVSLPGNISAVTSRHPQYGPVVALQNRAADRLDMTLGRILWRRTLRHASSVPVSVPQTWEAIPEIPRDRSCLIPLGTDTTMFHPPPYTFDPDPPVILYAGNLIPAKGVDNLVRAFVRVHAALPRLRLVVAGDGSEAASLARLAVDLGVADHVEFLGSVSFSEMPSHYRNCTLFCLPTLSEAFGISLLQAMASGRPVVATRVGGIPSFVEHGRSGLLVPPKDPESLAAALLDLLTDPDRRREIGCYNRTICVERYDLNRIVDRIESVYREISIRF